MSNGGATTSITNYNINDLDSFKGVTGDAHRVAGLYFYMILDCLVDLSYRVSFDFFKRPHLYTNLKGSNISENIAKLHSRYGNHEEFLSKEQRFMLYDPIFGHRIENAENTIDDTHSFQRLSQELLSACAAFAERVFDTGVDMLRERVRISHRPFKEYLRGLQGNSLSWSFDNSITTINEGIAYNIHRDNGVSSVFGINNPIDGNWPYKEDSNANKVVEEISKQLQLEGFSTKVITREHFSNLQRTALRGAEGLATIIDFDENSTDKDLAVLITKGYKWGSSLSSIYPYLKTIKTNEV